jgi:hypothetical protein
MSGAAQTNDRLTAVASAIIAVLAALATLFANHRSITALSLKNDAVLTTAKASDLFATYQTKRVRIAIYSALDKPANLSNDQSSSIATLGEAKKLQDRAALEQEHSDALLHSYETFEVAATLFEIAIVFASIAALTSSRLLLWFGVGLSGVGLILLVVGFVQPR